MIRPGDIGLSAKRTGWYPAAVRFFTRSKYSHVFIVMPEYLGEMQILESNLEVGLRGFTAEYIEKNADAYRIYRPIKANESEIYRACAQTFAQCNGNVYGFLQIPWFAARSICAIFGITLTRNWFPWGQICSEVPDIFLDILNKEYKNAFSEFGENETSPEDIAKVIESRPDLFQFVMERK